MSGKYQVRNLWQYLKKKKYFVVVPNGTLGHFLHEILPNCGKKDLIQIINHLPFMLLSLFGLKHYLGGHCPWVLAGPVPEKTWIAVVVGRALPWRHVHWFLFVETCGEFQFQASHWVWKFLAHSSPAGQTLSNIHIHLYLTAKRRAVYIKSCEGFGCGCGCELKWNLNTGRLRCEGESVHHIFKT